MTLKLSQVTNEQISLLSRHLLNYSRDHGVQEGLDYTAAWNMVMLTTPVSGFFSLPVLHCRA